MQDQSNADDQPLATLQDRYMVISPRYRQALPPSKTVVNSSSRQNQIAVSENSVGGRSSKRGKLKSKIYVWGSMKDSWQQSKQQSVDLSVHNLNGDVSPYRIQNRRTNSKGHEMIQESHQVKNEEQQLDEASLLCSFKKKGIVNVQCGRNHAAFVSGNGELFMMGSDRHGQIGIGDSEATKDYRQFYEEPVFLSSLFYKGLVVDSVACGFSHTLVLTRNGKLFSWGYGKFGALGNGNFDTKQEPTEIRFFGSSYESSSEIESIQCGAHHSGLLDKQGQFFMWGAGEVGQTGSSNRINECLPQLVNRVGFEDQQIQEVALGYFHTLILTSLGKVYQTGISAKQLKVEPSNFYTIFAEVTSLKSQSFSTVKAREFSAALTADGMLCVFSNSYAFTTIQDLTISDFELSRDYVVIRTNDDQFLRYHFESGQLLPLEGNNKFRVSDLSILSCGHSYILGVHNKKRTAEKDENGSSQSFRGVLKHRQSSLTGKGRQRSQMFPQPILQENREPIPPHHRASDSDNTQTQVKRISSGHLTRCDSKAEIENAIAGYNSNTKLNGKLQLLSNQRYDQVNLADSSRVSDNYGLEPLQNADKNRAKFFADAINGNQRVENKSIRISYDDLNYEQSNDAETQKVKAANLPLQKEHRQQSRSYTPDYDKLRMKLAENQKATDHRTKNMSDDFVNNVTKGFHLQSERKRTSKERLKEALQKEIKVRQQIETQMHGLQQEFEIFKREVGVDQMRLVLQESQQEYQKLYEICVSECEKKSKFCEMYKKEKKMREERENQIIDSGEEQEMLKNQIRHLEDQLAKLRDLQVEEQCRDQGQFKEMAERLLELQSENDQMREQSDSDKQRYKERLFDLEETLQQMRDEVDVQEQIKGALMIEKQNNLILVREVQDLRQELKKKDEKIHSHLNDKQVLGEALEKERSQSKQEISSLQNLLHNKVQTIKEYDHLFAKLQEKENEYKLIIEKLQSIVKTYQSQSQPSLPQAQLAQQDTSITIQDKDPSQQNNQHTPLKHQSKVSQPPAQQLTSHILQTCSQLTRTQSAGRYSQGAQISQPQPQTKKTRNELSSNQGINQPKIISQTNKTKENLNVSSVSSKQIATQPKAASSRPQAQHKTAAHQEAKKHDEGQDDYTLKQEPAQPQQKSKNSRSSSPIDFYGFKPKAASNYVPRLQQQNQQANASFHTAQSQQQPTTQGSQKPAKQNLKPQHCQGKVALKDLTQAINKVTVQQANFSTGGLSKVKSDDELTTPSQYSLTITPTIQSFRGGPTVTASEETKPSNNAAAGNAESMFDREYQRNTISPFCYDKTETSTSYPNQGNPIQAFTQQIDNDVVVLNKSFDAFLKANSSGTKKQVKFKIEEESDENSEPEQPLAGKTKEEAEIDKLYESLSNDMKGLKNCNIENLKGKLESIRKNKQLLEEKIREYERKLGN